MNSRKVCSMRTTHVALLAMGISILLLAARPGPAATLSGAAQGRQAVGPSGGCPPPTPMIVARPATPIGALGSSSAVAPQGAPSAAGCPFGTSVHNCGGCPPARCCAGAHCGGCGIVETTSTRGSCGRLGHPKNLLLPPTDRKAQAACRPGNEVPSTCENVSILPHGFALLAEFLRFFTRP